MITGGLLLPVALAIEGATSLPVPTLPVPGLTATLEFGAVIAVAHLLYGLVLGRIFAAFTLVDAETDGCRSTRSTGSGRGDTRPNLRSLTQRPCPRDERRV